ncbi:MAG TPA: kelch repeat-containing protein [Streptosporangiaceae bacterium]
MKLRLSHIVPLAALALAVGIAAAPASAAASGTFTTTASMSTARTNDTATLLPNGEVLVAGGAFGGTPTLTSAELYNPATGTWTPTGSMTT